MFQSPLFRDNWPDILGLLILLEVLITVATLVWVLHTKRETMSAIAWSLTVLLLPILGPLLFVLFGWQSITRPMARRRRHRKVLRNRENPLRGRSAVDVPDNWKKLASLGFQENGFPVTAGNRVTLYHDGHPAYEAMLEAIRASQHHVHIQFFIFRSDSSGQRFIDALCECASRGVEVRFLYDSVGSYNLASRLLNQLRQTGGKVAAFLPILNPLYRFRVNLRNHRKILIVDGQISFTGGLNIGDEYLGLHARFGPWRDTFLRLKGPGTEWIQQVFVEDWYFASDERLEGRSYFPRIEAIPGGSRVQVLRSGPDAEYKSIRETYFAAIVNARGRVWIASPYCVPDAGLRDALCFAARSGVDVRFLGLFHPDKWTAYLAARYYWSDLLAAGVKVYQYSPGMMHSKLMLVDGEWASVGTANFDNRSLLLNFEVNCQLFDQGLVAELEEAFLKDLEVSVRIDPTVYAQRPPIARLAENASRLLSPVL